MIAAITDSHLIQAEAAIKTLQKEILRQHILQQVTVREEDPISSPNRQQEIVLEGKPTEVPALL
jgi:hypothetical protein